MSKPYTFKFTCGEDLSVWLEETAEAESRSVASVIRLTLYQAKKASEQTQKAAA